MGILTISINDKIEKAFRETVYKVYGVKKGSLSKALEEAMVLWVHAASKKVSQNRRFYAKKDETLVAEAPSLQELADKLNKLHISLHDVLIFSDDDDTKKEGYLGLKVVARESNEK